MLSSCDRNRPIREGSGPEVPAVRRSRKSRSGALPGRFAKLWLHALDGMVMLLACSGDATLSKLREHHATPFRKPIGFGAGHGPQQSLRESQIVTLFLLWSTVGQ